jgi:hypothetical protein
VPAKTSLAVVERAFRGTIEEQYGHIVWLSGIMRAMKAPHSVLLRGPAVLFGTADQPRQSLQVGDLLLTGLPHYESALRSLVHNGGAAYVYEPDVARYGIRSRLMPEVTPVNDAGVIALYEAHHYVWYW